MPLLCVSQGISKSVDYVAEEHERWEPVSPKRQISLRRRAADVEAERAAEEETPTVMKIPAHGNMFAPLAEDETDSDDVLADPLPDKGGRYAQSLLARDSLYMFAMVEAHCDHTAYLCNDK